MTEHTLPLKIIAHSDGIYIIDADGEVFNDDAFVVTACNCHAELLAVCKLALQEFQNMAALQPFPDHDELLRRRLTQAIRNVVEQSR